MTPAAEANSGARPPSRVFLGWDEPLLGVAARWLFDLAAGERAGETGGTLDTLDLESVLVVVPGRRASRRMLERLVELAACERRILVPPQIVTLGSLPERLAPPPNPGAPGVAGEVEARLVRAESLRTAPAELREAVFPMPPDDDDWPAWLALAIELERLDDELGAEGLDTGGVVPLARELDGFGDDHRWLALDRLRQRFERDLERLGKRSRSAARLAAVRGADNRPHDAGSHDSESSAVRAEIERVVVVGVVDLPRLFRRVLESCGAPVWCLIAAPSADANRFDTWGCPTLEGWLERDLDLGAATVEVVDRAVDQPAVVTERLRAILDQGFAADQISVALGDARVSRSLLHALELAGLGGHSPAGRPMASSEPALVLLRLSRFLAGRRLADLATLVRTPVLESYLAAGEEVDWPSALDTYTNRWLQTRLGDHGSQTPSEAGGLGGLELQIADLFAPVAVRDRRPLAAWAPILVAALERLMPGELDSVADGPAIEVLARLGEILSEVAQIPSAPSLPAIDLGRALALIVSALEGERVTAESGDGGIEVLGWLEIGLDDAPVVAVLGMNQGTIPTRVVGDPFLPERLRARLGVGDGRRRHARDAFLLAGLVASRERLLLLASRQSADGEPLAPSPLLLAARGVELATRVERFYRSVGALDAKNGAAAPTCGFAVPRPEPLAQPIARLRATAFRDYLRCPYRFYLRHVLGLEPVTDLPRELDARVFGALAHEVLRRFALTQAAQSPERDQVIGELHRALAAVASERLGRGLPAAVRVQLAQLGRRLETFGRWQAEQTVQGWRIDCDWVERRLETTIEVDGAPFVVSGTIDRVDRHPEHGLRLIDYKTSETPKTPEQAHYQGSAWIDLQLPIYRRLLLAARAGAGEPVEVGYLGLSRRLDAPPYFAAEWQATDYASAEEAMFEVVRALRQERFWPPAEPPRFDDGYGLLCGDTLAGRYRPAAREHKGAREASGAPQRPSESP